MKNRQREEIKEMQLENVNAGVNLNIPIDLSISK